MGAGNEWANDPDDDVDHMPLPWWARPALLGVAIAAVAVVAGSVGRYNRHPNRKRGGRRG